VKAERWTAVSASAFEWEREALDFARANLPDHEPWRAWSNFEFIDDEGWVNELDLLVRPRAGLILVEINWAGGRHRSVYGIGSSQDGIGQRPTRHSIWPCGSSVGANTMLSPDSPNGSSLNGK